MQDTLDWIRANPVLSAIVALGSAAAGGVTALLLWGPNPSAAELQAAEEQMVTNAEPVMSLAWIGAIAIVTLVLVVVIYSHTVIRGSVYYDK